MLQQQRPLTNIQSQMTDETDHENLIFLELIRNGQLRIILSLNRIIALQLGQETFPSRP